MQEKDARKAMPPAAFCPATADTVTSKLKPPLTREVSKPKAMGPRKGLPVWGEEEQRSGRGVVIFTAPMDAEFVTTKGVALRATELE